MIDKQVYSTYKPSGKAPISGIIFLLIATTILGILTGLIASGIAQFVYLIIVFPIFMITIGVGIVGKVSQWGKIRNQLVIAFFGLWVGMLIYGSYWTGEYLFLVEDFYQEYREDNYTRFDALDEVGVGLENDTGYPHVIGYILWSIEGGLELISGNVGSEASYELNPQQTAIYWGVEAMAVILLTGIFAYISGNKPFSESCDQWYSHAESEFLGYVLNENGKTFIEHLRAQNLEQAASFVNMEGGNTELFAYSIPNCSNDEILLKAVRHQGQNVIAVDGIMTQSGFSQFKSLL